MNENTPIAELMAQYTAECCDFTDMEWVRQTSLHYVKTMPDSQVRCLLYALALDGKEKQAIKSPERN